jgi:enoyl-CoA hydratase
LGPPAPEKDSVALAGAPLLRQDTVEIHGRARRLFPATEARDAMSYENILIETKGAVGIVTLNRPKALNALCAALVAELGHALDAFEADDTVGCVIVTGSEKAFAAGADIKEMAGQSYMSVYLGDFITKGWERITTCRKPIVAAVAGFALGGGCEVAMMCDTIIAADTAKFGQPEITLGIIPGAGGTQRLTRFVGKAKAMDLILTGRMMDAAEAERSGLVSRVVPADKLLAEALAMADKIASMSRPSAMMAKESVNRAYETTLNEGVRFERRLFHSLFATEDQKEGMTAFIEKRKPAFKNR